MREKVVYIVGICVLGLGALASGVTALAGLALLLGNINDVSDPSGAWKNQFGMWAVGGGAICTTCVFAIYKLADKINAIELAKRKSLAPRPRTQMLH